MKADWIRCNIVRFQWHILPFQVVNRKHIASIFDESRFKFKGLIRAIRWSVDCQMKDAISGFLATDFIRVFSGRQQRTDDRISFPIKNKVEVLAE